MTFLNCIRVVSLAFSCVTLGLVAHAGGLEGGVGLWCMFCWTVSFTGTLLVLVVETLNLTEYFQSFWVNFPSTFFSNAALLCLFASIIFPKNFIVDQQNYDVHNHLVAAGIFSCLATLAYLLEAWYSWVEAKCFMATTQGRLLVCQTYVAGIIFVFISSPVSYNGQAAVKWCMAVYCICFICSVASIIKIVIWNPKELGWLTILNLCAAVMYLSAAIIWPVFKFNSHYPSEIYLPQSCQGGVGLCPWGRLVAVTVLTAFNLLLYSLNVYFLCSSASANEHYTVLVNEIQQHSSVPNTQLLGNDRRNLRSYQSLN
ncbi:myeloid-associated differentiation marker homolog [Hoplias malabaricus]|uniref:myeloid-associated differentiation marker homolog n=1 Tax=Hoplias malabaricus TaxID=27720 RepID=UPI00346318C0